MRRLARIWQWAYLLLVLGFGSSCQNQSGPVDFREIVAAPDSIQAWRTVGSLRGSDSSWDEYIKKAGSSVGVGVEIGNELSKVLLEKDTFPPYDRKNCVATPGVVMRFSRGKHYAEVYLCFECNLLIVLTDLDLKQKREGATGDFSAGRAGLVRMVKKIFPQDKQLQAL